MRFRSSEAWLIGLMVLGFMAVAAILVPPWFGFASLMSTDEISTAQLRWSR